MLHLALLLGIVFRATALATLLALASGSLHATFNEDMATSSVARCALIFKVVYPGDEGGDPYPICSSHCPADDEVWFDGVAYKHFCDLNHYNMMVEATFRNGELQGCKMVPLLTDEELTTRQTAIRETLDGCLANIEEETTNSSNFELGPVPEKLSGFTRVGNSFYLVSPMPLSWQDGAEFCEQYGATLAIVESQDEQRLIQEVLNSDVWIGLSDATTEGNFTNRLLPEVDYTNWADEQPDNGNCRICAWAGKNEDCAMMVQHLGYRWVDASCDLETRVLCEWLFGRVPRYSCPADSHMFQTSVCFHVSGPSVTGDYSQAINYCTSRGMVLASIHSQDEETFIERHLNGSVWIGMDDHGREGDFQWIDGTPRDYNHFASGQPDQDIPAENCVEIRQAFDYHWNDWLCNMKMQFLCRMAADMEWSDPAPVPQ